MNDGQRTPRWWCDNLNMLRVPSDDLVLANQIRQAFRTHDIAAFGALLSDDVRWGDDDHPRRCRNRSDVLSTFDRLLSSGVDGTITEMVTGAAGILCRLSVTWPENNSRLGERDLYHVYLVTDGRISEIRRYDDRRSAAEAAGVPDGGTSRV